MQSILDTIKKTSQEIEPYLKDVQHYLHHIPELGENVPETHDYLVSQLQTIEGIKIQEHRSSGYGIIATINGSSSGKCVLLRADIDALPINEHNDLPWISIHSNMMHACGHDAHATWILGAAKILSILRNRWNGTVKFIFQPAEEIGKCAEEFITHDLVLENPKVEAAIAGHNWPTIPSGKIGIPKHIAFGCVGTFNIEIFGKGGHASWPQYTVDPIKIVREILKKWDDMGSVKYASTDHVLSTTYILSGNEKIGNVIPESAKFGGTFRFANQKDIDTFACDMKIVLEDVVKKYNSNYKGEIVTHKGNVKNDSNLVTLANEAAKDIVGSDNALVVERDNLGGENFSVFSEAVPSVYIFIGNDKNKDGSAAWLHDPNFIFDDNTLANASATFANLAIKILNS